MTRLKPLIINEVTKSHLTLTLTERIYNKSKNYLSVFSLLMKFGKTEHYNQGFIAISKVCDIIKVNKRYDC